MTLRDRLELHLEQVRLDAISQWQCEHGKIERHDLGSLYGLGCKSCGLKTTDLPHELGSEILRQWEKRL